MFYKSVNSGLTSEDSKLLYGAKREKYYLQDDESEQSLGKRCFSATLLCCCCVITLVLFFIVLASTFFVLTWVGVLGNECELEWTYRTTNITGIYQNFERVGKISPFRLNGASPFTQILNITKTDRLGLEEEMYIEVYRDLMNGSTRVYGSSYFRYLYYDFGQNWRNLQELSSKANPEFVKIGEKKLSKYC